MVHKPLLEIRIGISLNGDIVPPWNLSSDKNSVKL
jgi:hypothetical protein